MFACGNTDMEYVYTMRTRLITVLTILVEGILMNEASLQYASKGETIHIKCLFEIVNFWQKLETQFILASCEGGLPVVNSTISNRMSVSDTCQTLTINNLRKEDVGIYNCFSIKNNKQAKHEIIIILRTLTIGEANGSNIINRNEGENITLTCFMNEAKQDALMYWRAAENVLVSNISNYVTYRFQTQPADDMKYFVCTANISRIYLSLEATVQLNLMLKPRVTIISSPCPPTVKRGHTIRLSCHDKSGNNGTINSFVWSHEERVLQNTTQTIQFTSVKIKDAGKYKCTAKNRAGEDTDDIVITVTYYPNVENETVVFTTNDRRKTLQCKVFGVPDTYFYSKWLHYTYSNKLVRTLDGQTNGTLVLPNTDPDDLSNVDRGIYVCNVTNNITDDEGHLWQTGRIHVIIKGKPEMPSNVQVISLNHKIKVKWQTGYNGGSQQTLFIEYKKHFELEWKSVAIENKTSTTIEGLQMNTVYVVRMFSKTIVGESNKTEEILVKTGKPEMPSNVQIIALDHKIIVKWQTGYKGRLQQTLFIEYKKHFQLGWKSVAIENKTSTTIEGLQMETVYVVRLFLKNDVGESNKTGEIIVKTGYLLLN